MTVHGNGPAATLGLLVFVAWGQLQMAHLYVPLAAAALFLWGAATGSVVSTLSPTPTDPHALGGGSLLKGAGALVATSSNLAFAAATAGAAYLFDTGRLHPAVLAAAGIVLGAAAVAAVGLTTRAAGRVMLAQRERIMADASSQPRDGRTRPQGVRRCRGHRSLTRCAGRFGRARGSSRIKMRCCRSSS